MIRNVCGIVFTQVNTGPTRTEWQSKHGAIWKNASAGYTLRFADTGVIARNPEGKIKTFRQFDTAANALAEHIALSATVKSILRAHKPNH